MNQASVLYIQIKTMNFIVLIAFVIPSLIEDLKIIEIKNRITNKINRTRIDKEKKIAKINNFVNPYLSYLSYAEAIKTQHIIKISNNYKQYTID